MHVTIVTLFPEYFDSPLACGLMGKARQTGLVTIDFVNPRDFATDRHHTVDDRPYGGGPGMVMLPGPLSKALRAITSTGRMLSMTPGGTPFSQTMARGLAQEKRLVLVCGRYEGMDARLESIFPLEPICMGDFVLNGGETAAMALLEATLRLIPGYMGHHESGHEESFSSGLLEYPHYTRPEVFEGHPVPAILRSGDHRRIAAWRKAQALHNTLQHRPDLLHHAELDAHDFEILKKIPQERPGRNLYCALVHYPVVNKEHKSVAVSLTNLDIHDIARCSCTYGLGGYYITTPIEDQQRLLDALLRHWTEGAGAKVNPDRAMALRLVRGVSSIEEAMASIEQRTGQPPVVIATSARGPGDTGFASVANMLREKPVLLLFGTAHGLAPAALELCDGVLRPLRAFGEYNHLSVRTAAAVIVDRILGDTL